MIVDREGQEASLKQIQAVHLPPTRRAGPGEKCELTQGGLVQSRIGIDAW
jgi:hypothetical protein